MPRRAWEGPAPSAPWSGPREPEALIGVVGSGSVSRFRRRGLIELKLTGLLGIIVGAIAFVPNLVAAVALATAIGPTESFLGVIKIFWL